MRAARRRARLARPARETRAQRAAREKAEWRGALGLCQCHGIPRRRCEENTYDIWARDLHRARAQR